MFKLHLINFYFVKIPYKYNIGRHGSPRDGGDGRGLAAVGWLAVTVVAGRDGGGRRWPAPSSKTPEPARDYVPSVPRLHLIECVLGASLRQVLLAEL